MWMQVRQLAACALAGIVIALAYQAIRRRASLNAMLSIICFAGLPYFYIWILYFFVVAGRLYTWNVMGTAVGTGVGASVVYGLSVSKRTKERLRTVNYVLVWAATFEVVCILELLLLVYFFSAF